MTAITYQLNGKCIEGWDETVDDFTAIVDIDAIRANLTDYQPGDRLSVLATPIDADTGRSRTDVGAVLISLTL